MSSSDYGWHPIERHVMLLEGFDGAVTMEADSLLAASKNLACPDAVGLTTVVRIDRSSSSPPIEIVTHHAYYGSLQALYADLLALHTGRQTNVTITTVGLQLRLYEHNYGGRSGVCIAGDLSDIPEVENFPWPLNDIGDRLLLEREAAFHLRFALRTSLVDVKRFADNIHQLLCHVQTTYFR